jgi:hypothetical protein
MATLCEHPTFATTSLPKSRGQAVLTLRELASSLKPRGGGTRLGDVVAFLVIDQLWEGRPCSSAVSCCPSPDPDAFLGPVALAFAVYVIFNGGPLILDQIYPTSCSRPRPSHIGRSLHGHERRGSGHIVTLRDTLGSQQPGYQRHHVDRRRNCRRGCAGATSRHPKLGAGACTRPSGCELTAIIQQPMPDIPLHTSLLTWSSPRSAG